jgi:hypothetical protein
VGANGKQIHAWGFRHRIVCFSSLFGTDSDQNGMLEEIPRSGFDSYR